MAQCNVTFFTKKMAYAYHTAVDTSNISIDDDQLTPGNSSIEILKTTKIPKQGFIHFESPINYTGYITEITDNDYTTKITFKPLIDIFDTTVLIDTNTQGKTALEKVIADAITAEFISNSDSETNIPPLSVSYSTSTTSWGMDLTSDVEDMHRCFVELESTLIQKALSKYQIGINFEANFQSKTLKASIYKPSSTARIDADLPNVDNVSVTVDKSSSTENALKIYNTENYTDTVCYYLHPDGTYDTNNSDRITPPVWSKSGTAPEYETENKVKKVTKTFEEAAAETASSKFSGVEFTNNIELEIYESDPLIPYKNFKIGQIVYVIYNGTEYKTIYTGKEIKNDGTIKLLFGSLRREYTKKIRLSK